MGTIYSLPAILVGETDLLDEEVWEIKNHRDRRPHHRWVVKVTPVVPFMAPRSSGEFAKIDARYSERRTWMDENCVKGVMITHYIAAFETFNDAVLFSMQYD